MKKNNKTSKKVKTIEQKNTLREQAIERMTTRRTNALVKELKKKYGEGEEADKNVEEQLNQLLENDNVRTILCSYYGNYTVKAGEKTIRGRSAAEHAIKDKKLDVIVFRPTHCYIKANADDAEKIAEDLRKEIGRCYITKHKKLPAKEEVENLTTKVEEKWPFVLEKPTTNTVEVRKKAKIVRKKNNKMHANMKPYYAALHAAKLSGDIAKLTDDELKKVIKQRIRKFNHPLAEKIHSWLKEQQKKQIESQEYRAKHRQLTSSERKTRKKARKVIKSIIMRDNRMKIEKVGAKLNQEDKNSKPKKPIQTELNLAA